MTQDQKPPEYAKRQFSFLEHRPGLKRPKKHRVPVVYGETEHELTVIKQDLEAALKQRGTGTTDLCIMAQSCKRSGPEFGLARGTPIWIAWTYTRCYIATKVDPETGLPLEATVFRHADNIGRLFDTVAGQKRLKRELSEYGPRFVRLLPIPANDRTEVMRQNPRSNATSNQTMDKSAITRPHRGAKLRAHTAGLLTPKA